MIFLFISAGNYDGVECRASFQEPFSLSHFYTDLLQASRMLLANVSIFVAFVSFFSYGGGGSYVAKGRRMYSRVNYLN